MKDMEKARLKQARESLDEAKALLDAEMGTGFVLTNLYYAFYYPVLALMNEGQVPTTMQSVTLGLFERQYIQTGILKKEYYDAVRQVFEVKPKCSGVKTPVSEEEVARLLKQAEAFIAAVEGHIKARTG